MIFRQISVTAILIICAAVPDLRAQYRSPWEVPLGKMFYLQREKLFEQRVPHGVFVAGVPTNSQAEKVGLEYMDLVTAIGDMEVSDTDSYAKARIFFARTQQPTTITLWRLGKQIKLPAVITSPFGAVLREYTYELDQIIARIEKGDLETAGNITERAEIRKLLNRKNLLIAKLLVSPDVPLGASSYRKELAVELRTILRPGWDLIDIWSKFQDCRQYNVAAFILETYVAANPDEMVHSLSLGLTLARLKHNADADTLADRFLERTIDGKPHPYVAYHGNLIRSLTAENRGNWAQSWMHHQLAVTTAPNRINDDVMRALYLAAKLKDRNKFEIARALANRFGNDEVRPYLDSLDAYISASNGQQNVGRQLVAKWKNKPEILTVLKHWLSEFPEVVRTWERLR